MKLSAIFRHLFSLLVALSVLCTISGASAQVDDGFASGLTAQADDGFAEALPPPPPQRKRCANGMWVPLSKECPIDACKRKCSFLYGVGERDRCRARCKGALTASEEAQPKTTAASQAVQDPQPKTQSRERLYVFLWVVIAVVLALTLFHYVYVVRGSRKKGQAMAGKMREENAARADVTCSCCGIQFPSDENRCPNCGAPPASAAS